MNATIQTATIRENQFRPSDRQAYEHTSISLTAFWPHRRFLLAQQDCGEALQCVCSSLCEVYAKTGTYVQFVYKFLSREMCSHWFRHNYGLTLSSHAVQEWGKKCPSCLFLKTVARRWCAASLFVFCAASFVAVQPHQRQASLSSKSLASPETFPTFPAPSAYTSSG